jgi:hypothetical protein
VPKEAKSFVYRIKVGRVVRDMISHCFGFLRDKTCWEGEVGLEAVPTPLWENDAEGLSRLEPGSLCEGRVVWLLCGLCTDVLE